MHVRPDLQTIWFDGSQFTLRSERDEGSRFGFLGFFQTMPGSATSDRFEVARMVGSVAQMKAMVKIMCKMLDYYPVKDGAEEH